MIKPIWTDLMCVEFCNFFQEVITADSSAGSFSQLGKYNLELCTCVVISVPPRSPNSLRGCHGGSQSKSHHLFAMLLQAVQWPFVDERRITAPNVLKVISSSLPASRDMQKGMMRRGSALYLQSLMKKYWKSVYNRCASLIYTIWL